MSSALSEERPWGSMESAPKSGFPIEHVEGRRADGSLIEDMHFAQDLTGEDQPPFSGWFSPSGDGYIEVVPVAWRPKGSNRQENTMSKKDEVIHSPPPKDEAPADSVTPKPKVARTTIMSRRETQGWPTPRAEEKKVADLYRVLAQAKPYVQKSPTEPEPGAKKKLVEEIETALRTAATHDLIDRAKYMELLGADEEIRLMSEYFNDNPKMREKWIEWRQWRAAIIRQQEQEELRQMTGRHLGDGIAEK